MGASGSRPPNGEEPVDMSLDQFVLIFTAPPGVGKEELMGIFITENVDSVAYVARIGAVRATQPVRHLLPSHFALVDRLGVVLIWLASTFIRYAYGRECVIGS